MHRLHQSILLSILVSIFTLQIISIFVMIKISGVYFLTSSVQYSVKRIFFVHLVSSIGGSLTVLSLFRAKNKTINFVVTCGFLLGIILLLILPFVGSPVNNATRWIRIFGISLQPSCFFLAFYPYLNGTLLSNNKNRKSMIFFIIAFILIIIQPDFGSTLLLTSIWGSQVFVTNKIQLFWREIVLIIGSFACMLFIKGTYVLKRIMSIFSNEQKFNQTFLALKAIKYSKFGIQNSAMYVPEMHNDYFFTALCHNFGIIIAILVLILWCFLLIRMINAMETVSKFKNKQIMMGYIILIAGQSFLHLFTNLHLIPCKGISFPFLSAGGSLILSNALAFGIFLSLLSSDDKK